MGEFQTMASDPTHCANFDENVEQALIAFSQQEGDRQLLPVHEELLLQIAHCGECCYDWNYVKPVLAAKMDQVALDYEQTWPDCAEAPGENFHDQRMRFVELLIGQKGSTYTSTRRFLDALDKVL